MNDIPPIFGRSRSDPASTADAPPPGAAPLRRLASEQPRAPPRASPPRRPSLSDFPPPTPALARALSLEGRRLLAAALGGPPARPPSPPPAPEDALARLQLREARAFDSLRRAGEPPRVVVVVPVGVPACGKTTAMEALLALPGLLVVHEDGSQAARRVAAEDVGDDRTLVVFCSSDGATARAQARNPRMSQERAIKEGRSGYTSGVASAVKALTKLAPRLARSPILLLDKNHPPNAWSGVLSRMRKQCANGTQLVTLAVAPHSLMADLCTHRERYSFAPELPLLALARLQHRRDHPTLTGDHPELVHILLAFLKLFHKRSFPVIDEEAGPEASVGAAGFGLCRGVRVLASSPGGMVGDADAAALYGAVTQDPGFDTRRAAPGAAQRAAQAALGALERCGGAARVLAWGASPDEAAGDWLRAINDALQLPAAEVGTRAEPLPAFCGLDLPAAAAEAVEAAAAGARGRCQQLGFPLPAFRRGRSSLHITSWFAAMRRTAESRRVLAAFKDAPRGALGHCRSADFIVLSEHACVLPVAELDFPCLKHKPHVTVGNAGGWKPQTSDDILGALFADERPPAELRSATLSANARVAQVFEGVMHVQLDSLVVRNANRKQEVRDYSVFLVQIPPVSLSGVLKCWRT